MVLMGGPKYYIVGNISHSWSKNHRNHLTINHNYHQSTNNNIDQQKHVFLPTWSPTRNHLFAQNSWHFMAATGATPLRETLGRSNVGRRFVKPQRFLAVPKWDHGNIYRTPASLDRSFNEQKKGFLKNKCLLNQSNFSPNSVSACSEKVNKVSI